MGAVGISNDMIDMPFKYRTRESSTWWHENNSLWLVGKTITLPFWHRMHNLNTKSERKNSIWVEDLKNLNDFYICV